MKQAGLEVRTDAGGNLFGSRAGTAKLPVLLFGSHIDSVLKGGNLDGDVGSLSAVKVVRALNEGAEGATEFAHAVAQVITAVREFA